MGQRMFSGEPKAVWLTERGADRRMRLLEAFWFRDSKGTEWRAEEDAIIDGASIPRPLWSLVGSPYSGEYRRASIVHDIACEQTGGDAGWRRAADKMFFEACREGGCSWWEATVLYVGVRIGAWWGKLGLEEQAVTLYRSEADRSLERDFQEACERVLRQGETDDPEVVEQRTDEAFGFMAARKEALLALEGLLGVP